jgi:hypothetical protein
MRIILQNNLNNKKCFIQLIDLIQLKANTNLLELLNKNKIKKIQKLIFSLLDHRIRMVGSKIYYKNIIKKIKNPIKIIQIIQL